MSKLFVACFILFLLFGIHCEAQISEQGTVNINALVPESESGNGGGGIIFDTAPPVILDIEVTDIALNSARVKWKTNELSVPQINYGESSSYSKTYIGESFSVENSILLENLLAGTVYHFEVVAIDRGGNKTSSGDRTFKTLLSLDIVSPPNVSSFTAESQDGRIVLSWKNPESEDFSGVQINKKINSPALSFDQGEIIYSGIDTSFNDGNIENGVKYFYTAFSYNNARDFSSGAIASAIGIKTSEIKPPILPKPPLPPKPPVPPAVPPSDVKNLETAPDGKNKKIIIKWNNPEEESFEEVEIRRSKEFPALNPDEGELIYKGKGSGFEDANVEEGEVYYYTAFTVDKDGNYSSGVAATGTLKKLPPSLISEISINDASFISSKEALLLPIDKNGKIYVFINSEINVYYDGKNLPQTLKTIILTVGKSSYILSADEKKEFYKAKFISPRIAGSYPLTISVLDFRGGKIFQAKAEFAVEDYGKAYEFKGCLKTAASVNETSGLFGWIPAFAGMTKCRLLESLDGLFRTAKLADFNKIGVEGASVALYEFSEENNNWQLWPAGKYNQKNPQLTGKEAAFGFMVQNGRYKMSIRKDGYNSREEIINVGNNIVNGEIEIEKKADWRMIVLTLAVLAMALIVVRKIRRGRKKKI